MLWATRSFRSRSMFPRLARTPSFSFVFRSSDFDGSPPAQCGQRLPIPIFDFAERIRGSEPFALPLTTEFKRTGGARYQKAVMKDERTMSTKKTMKCTGALLALAAVLGSTSIYGQSGSSVLDLTFGTGGKVTTDFAGAGDGAAAIAVQPDGKLVVAGVATIN